MYLPTDLYRHRLYGQSNVATTLLEALTMVIYILRYPEMKNTTSIPICTYIKGQLLGADGAELDIKDYTAAVNNILHSLFEQCNMSLNNTSITPSSDNYNYRSYFETLLKYGIDAASSHLTNSYWYVDTSNMLTCDPTDTYTDTTNRGFITRWKTKNRAG
jgi:hypothetical protein